MPKGINVSLLNTSIESYLCKDAFGVHGYQSAGELFNIVARPIVLWLRSRRPRIFSEVVEILAVN